MLLLLLLGAGFGFLNSVQSRLVNNGIRETFPSWLVAGWVMIVAVAYALATRAIAKSNEADAILAYAIGQALGVVLGMWFGNGPLFARFHPGARSQ